MPTLNTGTASAQNLTNLPLIAGRVPANSPAQTSSGGCFSQFSHNDYDDCLAEEKALWDALMAQGLDTVCCPKGRKPYPLKPWVVQPENGRRFRKISSISAAQSATLPYDGTNVPVLQFNTPIGYDGVIDTIICGLMANGSTGFVEGSGVVTWRLSADRRYLEDVGALTFSQGSLAIPVPTPGSGLRIYSGNQITFAVSISAGGVGVINPAAVIVCGTFGWEYSR